MPRALAIIALSAAAGLAAPAAHAQDSLFGTLFSRLGMGEAQKTAAAPETHDRDREARNLRREYWERERARMAQAGLAREASNRTLAAR